MCTQVTIHHVLLDEVFIYISPSTRIKTGKIGLFLREKQFSRACHELVYRSRTEWN